MLRILILEDEQEKARLIAETLLTVGGVSNEALDHVVNANGAFQKLKATKYDLLILDINVPLRLDGPVVVGGGLRVLDAIKEGRHGVIAPKVLIGLTAYDSGLATATSDFSGPLWKLIKFDHAADAWKAQLKAAASYAVAQSRPPYPTDGSSYHTTLGIVVGLEDVELKSLLALSSDFTQIHIPHDPIRYYSGTFERDFRKVDVVIAAAPKMGMPVAAVVTTKLIDTFRPKFLMMTGICAGVRRKVNLGDVLVADPCWDWGAGKIGERADGQEQDLIAPYQWRLDTDLRATVREVGDDKQFLAEVYSRWTRRKPRTVPEIHIDALASGAAVVARKQAMDAIRKQHKNLLGVEMEIYAVLTAAEYASTPRPTCIGIKSVCDFGDAKKNDYAHTYAAYVSAEVGKEVALRYMAQSV